MMSNISVITGKNDEQENAAKDITSEASERVVDD
jgi:hypothetical protein